MLGVEYNDFVRNASDYPAVNDLMIAADILITDYSAIAFDYSILCRPIFCYAYDYDSYLAERGTYFAVDEKYPNKSCRTESELLQRIKNVDYVSECANTKRFRDEFVQYGVGATEMCIKRCLEIKMKIMINSGRISPFFTTRQRLLNEIKDGGYDVTLSGFDTSCIEKCQNWGAEFAEIPLLVPE